MSGEQKTFGNHGQHCNDLLMQELPWQNIEHPSCLILSERQNISTTLRQDFCQAEFFKVNN